MILIALIKLLIINLSHTHSARVIKMAANKEAALSKLFTQLQLAGEDGDYEYGLEVIEEILKLSPRDPDALACKIVCLIQESEFSQSLSLIEEIKSDKSFLYEKAYCLYKMEQYDKSLQCLQSLPQEERKSLRVLDLESQVYYRLGDYTKSAQGFQEGLSIDNGNERSANMVASLSYVDNSTVNKVLSVSPVSPVTVEQCFNLATVYLNVTKDYKSAEQLLRKAEKLCEESDSMEEEEIERDLLPIRIQLGYALQCMGSNEEAMSIYANVLKSKPTPVHQLTAANNVIVINGDKDIFDSKKKIKVLTNEAAVKKLMSRQLEIVLFNRCLFALRLNQLEQSRQILQEMKTSVATRGSELCIIAESALLYRDRKPQEAIGILERYSPECTSTGPLVYLTLAQLHWSIGNSSKAISVLEGIPNVGQYLGIISIIVLVLKSEGKVEECLSLLDQVSSYWSQIDNDNLSTVLWEIAQFKLEASREEDAAKLLQVLNNKQPKNLKYLSHLIRAYSRFDTKRAEEMSQSLPQLSSLSSDDADRLEQMPTFQHSRRARITTAAPNKELTIKDKKKKKKRKKVLPKNVDLSKPIDLERWFPLRERSYYRKSKKKGQTSSVGRGTQGMSASMAATAAKLDASKTKDEGAKATASRSAKPPQPQKKQNKKKKGRR